MLHYGSCFCSTIVKGLGAPYGGHNWNALFDWLTSLWWMPGKSAVLVHVAFPTLPKAKLRKYVRLQAEALEEWNRRAPGKLTVFFPPGSEAVIRSLEQEDSGLA